MSVGLEMRRRMAASWVNAERAQEDEEKDGSGKYVWFLN